MDEPAGRRGVSGMRPGCRGAQGRTAGARGGAVRPARPMRAPLAGVAALCVLAGIAGLVVAPARAQAGERAGLSSTFLAAVEEAGLARPASRFELRLLAEYGAMFLARGVSRPPVVLFPDANAVKRFQDETPHRAMVVAGTRIELQQAAADALGRALAEAREAGVTLTPRGGPSAARRSYDEVGSPGTELEFAL